MNHNSIKLLQKESSSGTDWSLLSSKMMVEFYSEQKLLWKLYQLLLRQLLKTMPNYLPPLDNLISVSTSHKLPFKQRLCLLEKCTFLLNGLLAWYSLGYSAALDFPRSMVWNVHHCTLPSPIFFFFLSFSSGLNS